MKVAVIWSQHLEMLTKTCLHQFKDLYNIIDQKYEFNFPDHVKNAKLKDQLLTDHIQGTAQTQIRKNMLQMSSGNKTQKTQGSSNKNPQSFTANALMSDIKTPDKVVFGDYNSVISGDKTQPHAIYSHDKAMLYSNDKLQISKKKAKQMMDISAGQTKQQPIIFSDNKK